MTYNFINDYSVIAHKKILEKLLECANEQNIGYAYDEHTKRAQDYIKRDINNENVDIYFLAGGTQTNMTLISGILRPFEAVICASSGHINVHETGAIEGRGHKCVVCETINGKVTVSGIESIMSTHQDEHMVKPKMVYISDATEIGTVYTLGELEALRAVCNKYNLFLYLDGARLASALSYPNTSKTISDIARLCDVFYIGGTKNGGYIGEALVIVNDLLKPDFKYHIKHSGAMLAKGFVGAIPFEVLFENGLYYEIGKNENMCADILAKGLKSLGYSFMAESTTNQIFPIVTPRQMDYIKQEYGFEIWEKLADGNYVIRLVTAFDTTTEICENFIEYIKKYSK